MPRQSLILKSSKGDTEIGIRDILIKMSNIIVFWWYALCAYENDWKYRDHGISQTRVSKFAKKARRYLELLYQNNYGRTLILCTDNLRLQKFSRYQYTFLINFKKFAEQHRRNLQNNFYSYFFMLISASTLSRISIQC